jgi:hypothetical protein
MYPMASKLASEKCRNLSAVLGFHRGPARRIRLPSRLYAVRVFLVAFAALVLVMACLRSRFAFV